MNKTSSKMRVHIYPCTKVVFIILCLMTIFWILKVTIFYEDPRSARHNTGEDIFPKVRYEKSGFHRDERIDANKIPNIIHQTWKSDVIPLLFKPWMLSWLRRNKDWEYWFWTDEDVRRLISIRFPQFLEQFDNHPPGGYRPDVFRYFVLYEFGGVYADLDMECLRPLDPLTWQYGCVLSQEPLEHAHFLANMAPPVVSNAFIACKPRHDFMQFIITSLPDYVKYVDDNNVLKATGPYMMTEVYKNYYEGDLYLGTPDEFQPRVDESMIDIMRDHCIPGNEGHVREMDSNVARRHKNLCDRITSMHFDNKPKKDTSYTVHYWTHSWAGPKHDPWNIWDTKAMFHIDEIKEFHEKHPK